MASDDGEQSRRREQRATRIMFFVAGFGMAAWAPLVPFVKARTHLGEGGLGTLLLCLGAGSIAAMPLAGALAVRLGCRRALIAASVLMALVLPLLAATSSLAVLAPALLVFGAAVGSLDCVMNIHAVIVERASGRPMMSGFHGLFSVGGIAGAGGVSALLAAGASPLAAAACVAALIAAAVLKAATHLLAHGGHTRQGGTRQGGTRENEGSAMFAVPRGAVLFIGALCCIVFLTEGSVLDWSAVFLTSERGVAPAYAGLGYAAFAVTMTAGRLTGDAIVRRVGGAWIVTWGGLCAAAGLCLATLAPGWATGWAPGWAVAWAPGWATAWAPGWATGMIGYALVGAGCSNIVPVLYTAAGRQTAMAEHLAVPVISTLGYAGILAGPAVIGGLAHFAGLPAAFLLVAALLLGVAASGRALSL